MGLKRREFLQRSGWLLAGLGVGETWLASISDRYGRVLALPTPRKLALLVGINQYPTQEAGQTTLQGCVTDVELQRELLIHRFGFQPSDVLTLTDSQATRQNIEAAFVSHLTEQAKVGDVVVFHFSGYGSRVSLGNTPDAGQNSLVPADDLLPTDPESVTNDLLEETLHGLLRSLVTKQAIAILDTSYTHPGTDFQGNLRIRSRARPVIGQPNGDELSFLEQLKSERRRLTASPLPTILAATAPSQLAVEQTWTGFSAGLFTYALTQSLWQATSPSTLRTHLSRATSLIEQMTACDRQTQVVNPLKVEQPLLDVSALILNSPAADGVVTGTEDSGKTVQLWLGGLPIPVLESYGVDSLFTISDRGQAEVPSVVFQLRSRTGLTGKAQVLEVPLRGLEAGNLELTAEERVGQSIREVVRVLPRNTGLTVALDSHLERIERVDATSAFATIPQVSTVAGDQPADYRFGRVPATTIALAQPSPILSIYQGRYGLFSLAQTLLPNTVGNAEEAVKVAVHRLTPHLKTLLAAKLLRLTENEGSSQLKVRASLAAIAPEARILMQREPMRADSKAYQVRPAIADNRERSADRNILTIPVGTEIQYRLYNDSEHPVYFLIFCLDSAGRATIVNPTLMSPVGTSDDRAIANELPAIAPGSRANVPLAIASGSATTKDASGWLIYGPAGLTETQIILSQSPFTQTLAALEAGMEPVRDTQVLRVLAHPLKVAQAVLQDLQNASLSGVQQLGISTDDLALDVRAWATFSFVYRVV